MTSVPTGQRSSGCWTAIADSSRAASGLRSTGAACYCPKTCSAGAAGISPAYSAVAAENRCRVISSASSCSPCCNNQRSSASFYSGITSSSASTSNTSNMSSSSGATANKYC